ncbi:hydroxyacylglutathione hydrolase [Aestuariirhabdus sp. Z084]|uniref:hydroxyacylglutathione hydrolase n=1 Tax=Aestuariirhabdus haliotis TaxID=2918751 RepID=UPI00201B3CA3|nr:hydroxyacylglutathione hydrolase [Aestuariirhabdus haliotis]MCL6414576.1 hydroxyacylglutathione hydrolase [Aestuariirhabdus haliotis]MCL6418442.1 hydroxyacylglutathione hydrolase [Aestuariirhabdus haliotis]
MLDFTPIPAFNDNYIWMLCNGQHSWVVDPGDAAPVIRHIKKHNLKLEGILVTHHHPDHIGGIPRLLADYPDLEVIGPENPRIETLTRRVTEGDQIHLLGIDLDIIETPGHTLDHICYFATPPGEKPFLLSGDTLFAGGCGRLFEGTPDQMHRSLQKLAALPANTQVCCAHEYTLANLAFAAAVEPANKKLSDRTERCKQLRADHQPTLPSSLEDELACNPFLRVHVPAVIDAAQQQQGQELNDEAAIFAAIRNWKDRF